MENKNELENYIINEKIDLDKIVDDYTPYLRTIIQNMVNNNLSEEDKEEDEKIETNKIETIKAKQMIVKMNADAYKRINNNEKYYAEMNSQNFNGEIDYYKVDDRIRNAWVVVITYEDTYGDEIMKRYTEGQYSYFVDCTTGEIIGGHVMDYTYKS